MIARTSELLEAGVHSRDVYAARDSGVLVEISRGVFRLASREVSEPDLVVVATRMPKAVLCLITALHLHGLTQEIPRAVHVALPRGVHPARLDHPPLEVYHFSPASHAAGVEERDLDGVKVRVTTPALAWRAATPAQLDRMAKVCRVQRVMRPYLEALT